MSDDQTPRQQLDAVVASVRAVREELQAQGIAPPPFVVPTVGAASNAAPEAGPSVAEQMALARKACEEEGIDFDKQVAEAKKHAGGPPKPTADETAAQLTEAAAFLASAGIADGDNQALRQLANAELQSMLRDIDARKLAFYRESAHDLPPAAPLEGDRADALERQVREDAAAGRSFAGRDLTGADLAGIDFAGADFRMALLEQVDLRGANLAGANFEGAVLVRANLEGATTQGIRLARANLGEARLSGVDLSGIDLRGASLRRVNLGGAKLTGAKLSGADLGDAVLTNADLHGADLTLANLLGANTTGATGIPSRAR